MADGAHPFQLSSIEGLDQALVRSRGKGDPNVIAKLVFLEQPRKASGTAAGMAGPACNQAAPFYSEFTPNGLVPCPNSKEDRVKHLRVKHEFTAGDLVYADATPVSIRVLFYLIYCDAPSTTGVQSASRL